MIDTRTHIEWREQGFADFGGEDPISQPPAEPAPDGAPPPAEEPAPQVSPETPIADVSIETVIPSYWQTVESAKE
jgi:hypothetical protein